MLAQQNAAGTAHAVGDGVGNHADLIGHLIGLQHGGAQHAERLQVHGVAQTEHDLVAGHGDHAAKYGAQERGRPAEQLSGEAEERLAGDKGVGHMPRQPAEGGNDGGDGRAPHAQRGEPQLSEDQQIVQQGVEAVGGQTEEHGNLRGLHAAVHERVPVDERGEEVGKRADGDVLLRQLDEPGVVAEEG